MFFGVHQGSAVLSRTPKISCLDCALASFVFMNGGRIQVGTEGITVTPKMIDSTCDRSLKSIHLHDVFMDIPPIKDNFAQRIIVHSIYHFARKVPWDGTYPMYRVFQGRVGHCVGCSNIVFRQRFGQVRLVDVLAPFMYECWRTNKFVLYGRSALIFVTLWKTLLKSIQSLHGLSRLETTHKWCLLWKL